MHGYRTAQAYFHDVDDDDIAENSDDEEEEETSTE
jgi:hypothetical protein